jgi:hypothetical protein
MYFIDKVNFVGVFMNMISTVLHKVNIVMSVSSLYSFKIVEITNLNALCHCLPKYKKRNVSCFSNRRMQGCVVILYKGKHVLCSR